MVRIFFVICVQMVFFGCKLSYAQKSVHKNISVKNAVPIVYNYDYISYNAGTQNWAVTQNTNGLLYVANNQGILEFTGKSWKKYPIKGNKIVRSVFNDTVQGKERLYVGAFEEFGYYERNNTNTLTYHSLSKKIKDYQLKNDEIWSIVKVGSSIYFQSFSSYFVYDGKKVIAKKLEKGLLNLISSGGYVFSQLIGGDFCILNNGKFKKLLDKSQYNKDDIVGVVNFKDTFLFITASSGIYEYHFKDKKLKLWKNAINKKLKKATANRVIKTSSGKIIIGSLNNGVFALYKDGSLLWHIAQSEGLNNNTVLGLFEDSQKNIWLALDNGISMLDETPKFQYYDFSNKLGMIEDMEISDNKMFLATNSGIYYYDILRKDLKKLPNFNSQVWFIDKYNKQIFVGHNKGTAILEDEKLKNIREAGVGGMDIKQGIIHGKNVLIESSYTYLTLFETNKKNQWHPKHSLGQFTDLINQIEIDHTGAIWANHTHKGVYRIHLDEKLKDFREVEFYESSDVDTIIKNPLQLLKLRGRIVLNNGEKFYTYTDEKQPATLAPFVLLNEHLNELKDTKKIIAIDDDHFWFVTQQAYYLVNFTDKYNIKDKIPFNTLKHTPNIDRASVYVDDKGESYFCLEGSIAKYLGRKKEKKNYKIILNNLIATDHKKNTKYKLPLKHPIVINSKYNSFVFNFQFPNFTPEEYKFSHKLEGYEEKWSVPTKNTTVAYQNIPYGNYVLKVRVRNQLGHIISKKEIPFTLYTPWYKSNEAFFLYLLLFLLLMIAFSIAYSNKNIKKAKHHFNQKDKKQEEKIKIQKQEIDVLKNEKLKTELVHKTKELATATVMNIKHDEFLETLITDLENIKGGNFSIKKGNQLINQIKSNISKERDWVILRQNFDLIHKNYFTKLKEKYPQLTSNDLRLSVLLSLHYSTKEIASIQGISTRGVEMARYRLRKKLNIEGDVNLTEFLLKLNI